LGLAKLSLGLAFSAVSYRIWPRLAPSSDEESGCPHELLAVTLSGRRSTSAAGLTQA